MTKRYRGERHDEEAALPAKALGTPLLVTTVEGSAILCGMEKEPEHTDITREEWLVVPREQVEGKLPPRLSQRRARLLSLVLEARYIPNRVEYGENGWQLRVPGSRLEDACRELRLYVEENRNWPPFLPPVRPMMENTLPTLCVLLLLGTFHNLTGLDLAIMGRSPVDWLDIGNTHGSDILMRGEWWRLVTALTLHVDTVHLLGNLAIGGFFVVYLCRDLGSGLAWSLLLASGVCGNLANAYLQLPSHSSVGSSTAIFGAVGILGAVTMMRYRHHLRRRWPVPIAAALALLVLLGTGGERTDLGAHLFGFLFGLMFGLAAEFLVGHFGRPQRLVNAHLAATSASVVALSWWLALKYSG